MKLFIRLMYDGTAYSGFQSQKNSRTVQEKLNEAAKLLFGFDCDVTGCSRTDAGVHALDFCAVISPKNPSDIISMEAGRVPAALNFHLPEDVSVFYADYRDDDFHPRYSVKRKTYEYYIVNSTVRNPLWAKRAYMPRRFLDTQALAAMKKAAACFIGKHDFAGFMSAGSSVAETVRTVYSCDVRDERGLIVISISADGFLYNMVRIISGTLFAVGCGRISADSIPGIIDSLDRSRAAETLPPQGLYLASVEY